MGSLPSRERELKPLSLRLPLAGETSLPSRERELKLLAEELSKESGVSLPSRERELKLDHVGDDETCLSRSLHGSVN